MIGPVNQSAYDSVAGFAVKKCPAELFDLLDDLVSNHLHLQRKIGSYSPDQYVDLLDALNESIIESRELRTLPKEVCKSASSEIIGHLSQIMSKPKCLHNNDIYCRVVQASKKETISVTHRDEYFHRITPGSKFGANEESIKMWIPLFCPSETALGVVPHSHKDYSHGNATYQLEKGKLSFQTPHKCSDLTPITVKLGHCLIFPSMLIHGSIGGGALDPLRISIEISPVLFK